LRRLPGALSSLVFSMPQDIHLLQRSRHVVEESSFMFAEISAEEATTVSWNHSRDCPVTKNTGPCQCNQGIMTERHWNYFESSLAEASKNEDDQKVCVTLDKKNALSFLARYLGLVSGARADRIRTVVNPEPRFRDTARLATSTRHERVNQSDRAVFGEHGFVSKTLRRCYDLIKRMIVLIQCFIQGSSSGPQHSLESVVAVGDPMRSPVLSPRARTVPGRPTIITSEQAIAPLCRQAIHRRRNLCKPLKEDYTQKCREVHQVQRDELALLCNTFK